jgi:hypothetical protein
VSKRKTFTAGQAVQVWRRVFGRWEPAVYVRPTGTLGCHEVRLGGGLMEFATRNIREAMAEP